MQMRYSNGKEIKIGDHLRIGRQDEGIVVATLDTGKFLDGYPAEEWSYLQRGILVSTQKVGLTHYLDQDEELTLVSRR